MLFCILAFGGKEEAIKNLRAIFNAWLPVISVTFPALRVRNKTGIEHILPAPSSISEITLRELGRARLEHVRKNGFLQHRPINPLLAWPKPHGWERAKRMMEDVNHIFASEGIDYRFEAFLSQDVEHLRAHIEKKGFDTLLAVLPGVAGGASRR